VTDIATAPASPSLALHEPEWFAPLYALPRLEIVSGQGSYVKDAGGRKYLDFVSGIAVNALGHTPSGLSRVVAKQMKELGHCSNLFANRPGMELAKSLTEATGYDRVFFCNSGTEGVESALKFARARARAAGREGRDVLAFRGGFHGRTMFALATTWTPSYREPFEPLVPGVRFADFNTLAGLDALLDEKVCAVIVEPVQGEGGGVPATKQFLQALRARTTALGAALVFDEVQCGMGRCGRLLASDHYGVKADYVVMSKALGGGLPLGAVLMTAEAAASLAPGMHGCTFGGGPVTSTAASFVLSKVKKPSFLGKVRKKGKELGEGLEALVARHATLKEARGLGLLRAVEIAGDAPYDPPALVAAARNQGLLLVRGGERAVRFLPPLTVSGDEIAEALTKFDAAVTALEQTKGITK
jgi:acetylornithine/N-succinyldiaminopimelate aminotransferase